MIDITKLKPLTAEAPPWPEPLADEAFYGLVGEIVRLIEPETEADPAGILTTILVFAGNAIGRGPHMRVEGDRHYTNLYLSLVGESAGGKGVSAGRAKQVVNPADPEWAKERIVDGLSSGEGLIHAVRNPVTERRVAEESERDEADQDGMVTETVDPGIPDKRLMVISGELAQVLAAMRRETNTLSSIVRAIYDDGTAGVLTKSAPSRTSEAHVSIVGHITPHELSSKLTATESANGFANRFMWIAVKRARRLPLGGDLKDEQLAPLIAKLANAITGAKSIGEMTMSDKARDTWSRAYVNELTVDRDGMFGAICGRAHAITLRLAVLYAALDLSHQIEAPHVEAALAVWRRAEESAAYLFGGTIGDRLADRLLALLEEAGNTGIKRSEVRDRLGSHAFTAQRITSVLELLESQGKARREVIADGSPGRSPEIWRFLPIPAYSPTEVAA